MSQNGALPKSSALSQCRAHGPYDSAGPADSGSRLFEARQPMTMSQGGSFARKKRKSESCDSESTSNEAEGRAYATPSRGVVKLYNRSCKPDYTRPWRFKESSFSFSTAFVISREERLLLTNRHYVSHAVSLEVRRRGDDRTFKARLLGRGTDCDLALVTVTDDSFWNDEAFLLEELQVTKELPALFSEVMCVGYPMGGENLCVTKGVVSRMDCEDHQDPWCNRLVIQIDAAINPGNSGGPAISPEGRCVGVAYESLKDGDTENIGYIIPGDVVAKFLETWRRKSALTEAEVAQVHSFGHGCFAAQNLENDALRRSLGLADDMGGIFVLSLAQDSQSTIRLGDVLLELEGTPVGRDGRIVLEEAEGDRVPFPFACRHLFIGDWACARVLRGGEAREVAVELCRPRHAVLSEKEGPHLRNYVILGGLVCVQLSRQFMHAAFGSNWKGERCHGLASHFDNDDAQSSAPVVISEILPADCNRHYGNLRHARVETFRGCGDGAFRPVGSLTELAELIDAASGDFYELEVSGGMVHAPSGFRVVLSREEVQHGEQELLHTSGVIAARRLA